MTDAADQLTAPEQRRHYALREAIRARIGDECDVETLRRATLFEAFITSGAVSVD